MKRSECFFFARGLNNDTAVEFVALVMRCLKKITTGIRSVTRFRIQLHRRVRFRAS
jgi:hypothetical protein